MSTAKQKSFTLQEFLAKNKVSHNKWFVSYPCGGSGPCTVLSKIAIKQLESKGFVKFASEGTTTRTRWPIGAWDEMVAMSKDPSSGESEGRVVFDLLSEMKNSMIAIRDSAQRTIDKIEELGLNSTVNS